MTDLWFSLGTLVSSTNKTIRHDITETLLKLALNTTTFLNTITSTLFKWTTFLNTITLTLFKCRSSLSNSTSLPLKYRSFTTCPKAALNEFCRAFKLIQILTNSIELSLCVNLKTQCNPSAPCSGSHWLFDSSK